MYVSRLFVYTRFLEYNLISGYIVTVIGYLRVNIRHVCRFVCATFEPLSAQHVPQLLTWSVHPVCVCVCRLLSIGMSLLQGDLLPNTLAKSVLREKIYGTALDFFRYEPEPLPTRRV